MPVLAVGVGMRRILPVFLLMACEPAASPHTGELGAPCFDRSQCDQSLGTVLPIQQVECMDPGTLEICSDGGAACDGVCVDLQHPSSPCPTGLDRCEVPTGSTCVDTGSTFTHCGGCGIVCPAPDGMDPGCEMGACCVWDDETGDCI